MHTVPAPETPSNTRGLRTISSYRSTSEILRAPGMGNGRFEHDRMRGTLPVIDGAEHLERRRLEARLFTPAAVERYEHDILRVQLDRFVAECRLAVAPGAPYRGDLAELSLSWLTQVAARIAGIDGVDDDESAARLRELTEGPVPEYAKVSDAEKAALERAADQRTRRFEAELFEPSVRRRLALIAAAERSGAEPDGLPADVLTVLLRHRDPAWDDELILREVLVYLAGSIRTTARSLVHLTWHLDRWFGDHPSDRARRCDPVFLRNAANETLRLHPVLPVLLRRPERRLELSDGTVFEAGERIALLFGLANRDPDVFGSDADSFDPGRGDRLADVPGYGLAFAVGSHTCIGRRLAMGTGVDQSSGTMGSLLTMALRLQQMAVRTDPDDPPRYDDSTYYDEYVRFPIVFDPWAEPTESAQGCPAHHEPGR